MSTRETYLVALDPRVKTQSAIERVSWLAERTGAEIALFATDYNQSASAAGRVRDSLLEADRKWLDDVADELRARDSKVDVDARWDEREDESIVRKTLESQPSLVIKETHYHSPLQRTLFTNADWTLIRNCPAPLLLVKDRPLAKQPQVLAAVDPGREHGKPKDLDRCVVGFAKHLAAGIGGRIRVLHVLDPAPALATFTMAAAPEAGIAPPEHKDMIDEMAKARRDAFEELLESESIDRSRQAQLERGQPAAALISLADELEADFVVMGAASRSRLRSVFVGHTAESVLDRLPCDLIVVKPSGFETDMVTN